MQSSIGQANSPSIFSCLCDVATGKFAPYINEQEALAVAYPCDSNRRNVITCKDKELDKFINEVNGLGFDIELSSHIMSLPRYIPVIDRNFKNLDILSNNTPIIGITLVDLLKKDFKKNINIPYSDPKSIFRPIKINSSEVKFILFLTGEDRLIETLWHSRELIDFFSYIKKWKYLAVTGFNFSLIKGECAFSQALNLKKSLYSSYLLENNGMVTIPHVYSMTQHQLVRWIEWFSKNKRINYFVINCQLQSDEESIQLVIENVAKILTELPYIHVILQGFYFNKINKLIGYLNRIHFADKLPIKLAQSHYKITENLKRIYCKDLSVEELTLTNIDARRNYIENLFENKNVVKA
ncbi:MAG TPA: hypothetical protein VG738_05040 [Chitinophagaceae bacterium]|nr:hypothetical protein [Chitinophagaceae bacterium]